VKLPRDMLMRLQESSNGFVTCKLTPLWYGMPSPWHVIIAALLVRHCGKHAPRIAEGVFRRWPFPHDLANVDRDYLLTVVTEGHCYAAADILRNISRRYLSKDWKDLRDIRGINPYICKCVEEFVTCSLANC